MVDGAGSLMTMVYGLLAAGDWIDRREANLLDGGTPFYDTYRCADGKHVAVGALEPQFYALLIDRLGITPDGAQHDREHWPALRKLLTEAFASRTRDEWADLFADSDACVAPVLSLEEAPHHPHLAARGLFNEVSGGFEPRVAPAFSRTPGRVATVPRQVGEDTADVLARAGFTADDITTLTSAGVVHQA
jgi:alpha-methylacyl-CoA racemase